MASGTSPDAATITAVTSAYQKFFAPDTPQAVSISLLQNGEAFRQTIIDQGKSSFAKTSSAKVTNVTLRSADLAAVTYTILVGGQPMIKNQAGYAVRENGTWKVAGATFCALLTLEGSAPPACTQPASTSLPK